MILDLHGITFLVATLVFHQDPHLLLISREMLGMLTSILPILQQQTFLRDLLDIHTSSHLLCNRLL